MNRNYDRNALDLFRILATVQVFLGHVITHFILPVDLTGAVYFVRGVPILFTLCGLLAAKSLDRYAAGDFLRRRAIRILPGFWSCIAVNSAIILALYSVTPTVPQALIYLVTQFSGLNFYTGDWLRDYGVGTPNGVLWTIGVQVQFFLLAPVLYRLLHRLGLGKSTVLVGILTLVSIAIEKSAPYIPSLLYKLAGVTVLPYLYFLVLGMLLWCFRDRVISRLEKLRWPLLLGYILYKLAELNLPALQILNGVLYNTVSTVLTVFVIFAFAFRFSWRMKRDLTYGFYLYHMVFINIAIHLGFHTLSFDWKGLLVLCAVTAATVLFAWLSQICIENPAAKLVGKKEGK